MGPACWELWTLVLGLSGQGRAARAHPAAPGRNRAARGTRAASPGIGHLPEDGHGRRSGQDVVLWVRVRNRTGEGKQGSDTVPGSLGRAKGTAPSEPRRTDQMRAAVCCDQGTTWAAGKVLGPRGIA